MTLTNKREIYDVEHQSSSMKINGTVTGTSAQSIISFNGTMTKVTGESAGYFNYSEMEDGMSNKNLNNIPTEIQDTACVLLDETIKLIKTELAKA